MKDLRLFKNIFNPISMVDNSMRMCSVNIRFLNDSVLYISPVMYIVYKCYNISNDEDNVAPHRDQSQYCNVEVTRATLLSSHPATKHCHIVSIVSTQNGNGIFGKRNVGDGDKKEIR